MIFHHSGRQLRLSAAFPDAFTRLRLSLGAITRFAELEARLRPRRERRILRTRAPSTLIEQDRAQRRRDPEDVRQLLHQAVLRKLTAQQPAEVADGSPVHDPWLKQRLSDRTAEPRHPAHLHRSRPTCPCVEGSPVGPVYRGPSRAAPARNRTHWVTLDSVRARRRISPRNPFKSRKGSKE
jgi:hypothetical protein